MSKYTTYFLYFMVSMVYMLFAIQVYNHKIGIDQHTPRLLQGSARVERIYRNLNASVGLRIRLVVVKNSSINAMAQGDSIYVNSGAARLGDNELAFLIGHEMSHIAYGADEDGADIGAIRILSHSGYNACQGGKALFKRLRRANGEGGGPGDPHSRNSDRIRTVERYACH